MSPPPLNPDEVFELEVAGKPLPIEMWHAWGPKPASAVLVISELFGVNDDMRRICRTLRSLGYTAALPDLYRGGDWKRCSWRAMLSLQRGAGSTTDELQAAIEWLDARDDVASAGAIGFCMGGGFALLLGTKGTAKVAGGFYGVTPAIRRMRQHMCPVVGGYGKKDRFFAREGRKLERALGELGVPNDVAFYDDAGHSFMSHHDASLTTAVGRTLLAVGYDQDAAQDSWKRIGAFFAEHLGPPSLAAEPAEPPPPLA